MDLTQLAGPAALAIAASLAVVALWKVHVEQDKIRDAALVKLTEAVSAFVPALKDLTAVVSDAIKSEKDRHE